MIKGRPRTFAPFFDKSHEYFDSQIASFSTCSDDYFKQRREDSSLCPWEQPHYHFDAFVDVLYGAYYVSQKLRVSNFDYPEYLARHFIELFHDSKAFEEALKERHDIINDLLKEQLASSSDKQEILNTYIKLQEQLQTIAVLLNSVATSDNSIYIKPAIAFCNTISRKILKFYNSARFTPPDVIEYNYHNHHKNESWLKYPFSFFINYLLQYSGSF